MRGDLRKCLEVGGVSGVEGVLGMGGMHGERLGRRVGGGGFVGTL